MVNLNALVIADWIADLSRFLFVLSCVTVPILWGIVVNWLFGRLQRGKPTSNENPALAEPGADSKIDQEEPVIEYYI